MLEIVELLLVVLASILFRILGLTLSWEWLMFRSFAAVFRMFLW